MGRVLARERPGREATAIKARGFGARYRLRRPADFAAIAKGAPDFRSLTPRLSLAARVSPAGSDQVRIGVTVGRRQAPKSVQRSLVKRLLREAARHALPALRAAAQGRSADIVLRLRQAFPAPQVESLPAYRRALRAEADAALAKMVAHLQGTPA